MLLGVKARCLSLISALMFEVIQGLSAGSIGRMRLYEGMVRHVTNFVR